MFESGKYGIEDGCGAENDYWAGAVKTCGSTKNMPSFDEYHSVRSKVASSLAEVLDPRPSYEATIWFGSGYRCGFFWSQTGSYGCSRGSSSKVAVCKE